MATTEIQDLAQIIAYNTAIYNHYLQANSLPTPSHYVQPPERPVRLPDEIEAARSAALEASHELHELLSGSVGHILNAAARSTRIMTLHFLKTYRVGYSLGWGEKTTFAAIAKESRLDEDDTKRMLRLAMAEYFFTETSDGQVMHTAASFELARNKLLSAWVGVTTQENWSPMLKITETLGKYPGSEEPLESAYAMAHNLKDDAFKEWEKDPARIEQFSDAMAFLHSDSGFQHTDVLSSCTFPATGQPTFVDVGGSIGHVSIGIARENPHIKFIVQDSEQTVARGRAELPSDLTDQVKFQVHDFWTEQPVKGADVYFFKTIFHDWSDKFSVKILRQLIPALKNGARVIIADICIPPKGIVSLYKEQWIRGIDIVMKCFTNAKEREVGDWAALFAKTDPRFKFLGARTPPGSKASIIEAQWISDDVTAPVEKELVGVKEATEVQPEETPCVEISTTQSQHQQGPVEQAPAVGETLAADKPALTPSMEYSLPDESYVHVEHDTPEASADGTLPAHSSVEMRFDSSTKPEAVQNTISESDVAKSSVQIQSSAILDGAAKTGDVREVDTPTADIDIP